MGESPHTSVRNAPYSIVMTRRVSKDSIKRLEHIIAVQEARAKKMRHQSVGSPSQTVRLRASMKNSLALFRYTLQQIRESDEKLELSWAMLDVGKGILSSS